jgi:anti-anti-sigma regulatory factor
MKIDISTQQGNVPVTVVRPQGDLDGSTYTELINTVRQLVTEGARDFVIDLSDVPFLSSAGLMAIFSATLLLQGQAPPDLAAGRSALKRMDRSRVSESLKHVKLLGLSPGVAETFDKAGFSQHFEIFSDLQAAVASF